jgi:hypothetical protein
MKTTVAAEEVSSHLEGIVLGAKNGPGASAFQNKAGFG